MKLETKFNVDQLVWFMYLNKPESALVRTVAVSANYQNPGKHWINITYKFHNHSSEFSLEQSKVFATKEELIKSL